MMRLYNMEKRLWREGACVTAIPSMLGDLVGVDACHIMQAPLALLSRGLVMSNTKRGCAFKRGVAKSWGLALHD
jgi:hypothetical protein